MDNATFLSLLERMGSCPEAVKWVDGFTLCDAYQKCARGDWMLWLAMRMAGDPGWPTLEEVVSVAADIAETVLKYVPDGEERPAIAIATARRWVLGEATTDECHSAARAADRAAAIAACAASHAANAACAACAACAISLRATNASIAATCAAHAAGYAAWYAARKFDVKARTKALALSADIVREKLPCPDVGDTA